MNKYDPNETATEAPPNENENLEVVEEGGATEEKLAEDEIELPSPAKRQSWKSKVGYILTLTGYAVGLGNFWRFPYMMRENGGLAFLIPYFVMQFAIGIPVFVLELAVGQRRRKGLVYTWKDVSPYFGGLGICCGWVCFFVGFFYTTILAWCLSYLADSIFYTPLPWTNCKQVVGVHGIGKMHECERDLGGKAAKYYFHRGTLDVSGGIDDPGNFNWSMAGFLFAGWSTVWIILLKGTETVEAVVYFTVLAPYLVLLLLFILNFIEDGQAALIGAYRLLTPQWGVLANPRVWLGAGGQIFFSLGLGYGCLVVFSSYSAPTSNCYQDAVIVSIINAATSMFSASVVFPMIGAFGFRQWKGCKAHMAKLLPSLNSTLWKSKNKDEYYDLYFTSIPYNATYWHEVEKVEARWGFGENLGKTVKEFSQDKAVFKTVLKSQFGKLPHIGSNSLAGEVLRNCSIGELATASGGGTGFVFMGFTEAVLNTEWSNALSVIFFFMLFTLGIDSGFGTVEGTVNAFEDIFRLKRWISTTIVVGILALTATITFSFGWGVFVLDLIDQWTASWTLLMAALLECIAVSWVYGLAQMAYDVKLMTGKKPDMYLLISWKYTSPLMIFGVLIGSIITFILDKNKEGGMTYSVFKPEESWKKEHDLDGEVKRPFPTYSLAIGFLCMILCMIWFPIQAALCKTKYSLVRYDGPCDFPEEKLRRKRGINVNREEDQFTEAEKKVMGSHSLRTLQEYRDKQTKALASKSSNKIELSPGLKPSVKVA